jgi:hypothetical protein
MQKTTGNMAAIVGRDVTLNSGRTEFQPTRELAVAPGLTYDEAIAYVARFLGPGERVNGFATYR